MISLLRGKILSKNENTVVILTAGGVGYEVRVSGSTLFGLKTGEETDILTYLAVRENAMDLYGFKDEAEKDLFLHFLDVSGVGPKTALHILSLGEPAEISSAINRGDVDYLSKVSGIGKKTAERLVVELKGKVESLKVKGESGQESTMSDATIDVIDGLVALGYSVLEAREIVKKLDTAGKTSEQLLREALKRAK